MIGYVSPINYETKVAYHAFVLSRKNSTFAIIQFGLQDVFMLTKADYLEEVLQVARKQGFKTEISARSSLEQINFENKKLHSEHLEKLYPDILQPDAKIPELIEKVVPGRPCAHKPMREIIKAIRANGKC